MRKLKTKDVPILCRCIKKLGIKERIRNIAQQADTVKDVWTAGFDIVWDLFDTATEQEGENIIYEFLSGPFEMPPEQVADLDLEELISNLQTLAQENNLKAFFKNAADLMK